jgi:Bacteriophage CI repressor helix-turn-helix domain
MDNFFNIWKRIQDETDLKKIGEFARFVGTTPQYVSRKKSKNEFSVEWAYKIAEEYGLRTKWVMTGKGPKGSSDQEDKFHNDFLHEIDNWLTEQVGNEPFRKEWFVGNFLDAFPKFAQWRKSLESQKNEDNTDRDSKAA